MFLPSGRPTIVSYSFRRSADQELAEVNREAGGPQEATAAAQAAKGADPNQRQRRFVPTVRLRPAARTQAVGTVEPHGENEMHFPCRRRIPSVSPPRGHSSGGRFLFVRRTTSSTATTTTNN